MELQKQRVPLEYIDLSNYDWFDKWNRFVSEAYAIHQKLLQRYQKAKRKRLRVILKNGQFQETDAARKYHLEGCPSKKNW